MSGGLGRRVPPDFDHIAKYRLTASTAPAGPVPVTIGVDWYANFDKPERDSQGHYWIGRGPLGKVRGGHCVCLKPRGVKDATAWWDFYDQGNEGACVGFGSSRMMTLLNRKRYFARWLWDRAKERDQWPETIPGDDQGTSVRAAMDVLRLAGHVPWKVAYGPLDDQPTDWRNRRVLPALEGEGISANRWATNVNQVLDVLGYSDKPYCDLLNSWGRGYPHLVRIPVEVLAKLLDDDGEFTLVTDR